MEETWTLAQLFEGRAPSANFVSQLERLGLLRVVARDEHGEKLYGSEAREQLDKVLMLVELGYNPKDIAVIARKVGLPARRPRRLFKRPPLLVHLDELGRLTGVGVESLQAWIDAGYLQPALFTDGEQPLFDSNAVEQARAIADLTVLGVSDDELQLFIGFEDRLAAIEATEQQDDAMPVSDGDVALQQVEELSALLEHIVRNLGRWRNALRRWDRIVSRSAKRLDRLRRLHGLPVEARRRRRRLRGKSQKKAKRNASS